MDRKNNKKILFYISLKLFSSALQTKKHGKKRDQLFPCRNDP